MLFYVDNYSSELCFPCTSTLELLQLQYSISHNRREESEQLSVVRRNVSTYINEFRLHIVDGVSPSQCMKKLVQFLWFFNSGETFFHSSHHPESVCSEMCTVLHVLTAEMLKWDE